MAAGASAKVRLSSASFARFQKHPLAAVHESGSGTFETWLPI